MKKYFLLLISAIMMGTSVYAWEKIPLTVNYDDNMPLGNGYGKSPMQPPTVYIEDYTLSFAVGHPEYVLQITDEDGDVVYTTTVFATDTQVVLPSDLSGNYVIQLTLGNWVFTGYINL